MRVKQVEKFNGASKQNKYRSEQLRKRGKVKVISKKDGSTVVRITFETPVITVSSRVVPTSIFSTKEQEEEFFETAKKCIYSETGLKW